MKPGTRVAVAVLVLAGCASPPAAVVAVEPPAQAPAPASKQSEEREVRYYRDASGALWDDRGRKVEPRP